MTTTPTAVADKPSLHCFKCRQPRTYTRLLASRPVYSCDGCGNTREVEELGRGDIYPAAPQSEPEMPPRASVTYWLSARRPRPKKKETTHMPRSPLQAAIIEAVKEQLGPIRDELAEIKKSLKNEDFDQKLSERLETEIPELVTRAVTQMLATPKTTTSGAHGRRTRPTDTASTPSGEACKHKNFMRKCQSCQAKHAAEENPE